MSILVTRPQPDAETTAAVLRAQGYEVLVAPMLKYEPRVWQSDDSQYAAVIATSANALRETLPLKPLLGLPLFAVGERTAEAAREAGFTKVKSADGDASDLRKLVSRRAKVGDQLLYLAGADQSGDLSGDLGAMGFEIVTLMTYRMAPVAELPPAAEAAFADGSLSAVLHYSRRTAKAFVEAARTSGVEITALALPQCCLSEAIADILRNSGAGRVRVASHPDQKSLFETLARAIGPRTE